MASSVSDRGKEVKENCERHLEKGGKGLMERGAERAEGTHGGGCPLPSAAGYLLLQGLKATLFEL